MTTYRVTSDLVYGRALGDTITDADLDGCNIDALIAGEHLAPISVTIKKQADKEAGQ